MQQQNKEMIFTYFSFLVIHALFISVSISAMQDTYVDRLPQELLQEIFLIIGNQDNPETKFANLKTVLNVRTVCKQWQSSADTAYLKLLTKEQAVLNNYAQEYDAVANDQFGDFIVSLAKVANPIFLGGQCSFINRNCKNKDTFLTKDQCLLTAAIKHDLLIAAYGIIKKNEKLASERLGHRMLYEYSNYPLSLAVRYNASAIIDLLLSLKARVYKCDCYYRCTTPLSIAIHCEYTTIAKKLISYGAPVRHISKRHISNVSNNGVLLYDALEDATRDKNWHLVEFIQSLPKDATKTKHIEHELKKR